MTLFKPGKGDVALVQDLLKRNKKPRVRTVIEDVAKPDCEHCLYRTACTDVGKATVCRINPMQQPRYHQPRRVKDPTIWVGSNLCSTCEEGWVCSMATNNKTKCLLWRKDKKW